MNTFKNIYFTKRERRGLMLLVVLIVLTLFFSLTRNEFSRPQKFNFDKNIEKDSTVNYDFGSIPKEKRTGKKLDKINNKINVRFDFDPNTISYDSLLLLGISKFAANNLIKYRKKGKLKSVKQFSSIYGMKEFSEELESHIKFSSDNSISNDSTSFKKTFNQNNLKQENNDQKVRDSIITRRSNKVSVESKNDYHFELNTVDSFQLQLLNGIGPYFSRAIVLYGEKLGGYSSVNQLYEIKVLPKETIEKIKDHLSADPEKIIKMNANTTKVTRLASHPYFEKKKAYIFDRYRANHPNLTSMDDFSKVRIFSEEEITRLRPYISF